MSTALQWVNNDHYRRAEVLHRARQGAAQTLGPPPTLPRKALPAQPVVPTRFVQCSSNWKEIIRAVALKHNVPLRELRGRLRPTHVVAARFELYYRLQRWGRFGGARISQTQIGRLLHRDHASVGYGAAIYAARLGYDL